MADVFRIIAVFFISVSHFYKRRVSAQRCCRKIFCCLPAPNRLSIAHPRRDAFSRTLNIVYGCNSKLLYVPGIFNGYDATAGCSIQLPVEVEPSDWLAKGKYYVV